MRASGGGSREPTRSLALPPRASTSTLRDPHWRSSPAGLIPGCGNAESASFRTLARLRKSGIPDRLARSTRWPTSAYHHLRAGEARSARTDAVHASSASGSLHGPLMRAFGSLVARQHVQVSGVSPSQRERVDTNNEAPAYSTPVLRSSTWLDYACPPRYNAGGLHDRGHLS